MSMTGGIVRVYDVVRSAHLERDADRTDVRIRYARTRYDFDAELARGLDARRQGSWSLLIELLRNPPAIIEVNEPLSFPAMSRLAAVFAATRFRRPSRRPRMVTYAIENLDPRPFIPTLPARARWTRRAWLHLAPAVWRRLDRVAFGTEQAADLYREVFGSSCSTHPDVRLIPHLPAAVVHDSAPRDGVVFVGDLSERKGFPRLLEAWTNVAGAEPAARLHIIGSGSGAAAAQAFAEECSHVEVSIDPRRAVIDQALRRAKVLVLPSERGPRWREQVGLPIVEGLARGCLIVTTTETGLAPWLEAHRHHVVPPHDSAALAEALIAALRSSRDAADILADLPNVDGREAADRWLIEP